MPDSRQRCVAVAYTLRGDNGSVTGYVALEVEAETEEAEILKQAKQKIAASTLPRALGVFETSLRILRDED